MANTLEQLFGRALYLQLYTPHPSRPTFQLFYNVIRRGGLFYLSYIEQFIMSLTSGKEFFILA